MADETMGWYPGNWTAPDLVRDPGYSTADTTPPTIQNFDPPVGTPIDRYQTIVFEVTDLNLVRAEIFVSMGGEVYVVHDGEKFRGNFNHGSQRFAITNGYRFHVRRNGGWITAPTFEVHAVDVGGNEAS
jgi:hypothetical protein